MVDACEKVSGEIERIVRVEVWVPKAGQVGHHIQVLAGKGVSRLIDVAEDALEVAQAKIVHVFVEDVEPRALFADPVETGHLDVDLAAATVGLAQMFNKSQWVLYVLQYVAKNKTVGMQPQFGGEVLADDVRVVAFIRRIEAGDVKALRLQVLEEIAFAAADFDQLLALEHTAQQQADDDQNNGDFHQREAGLGLATRAAHGK